MKTFLKVIGGIFASIVLLIAFVFFLTSGMVDQADRFFQAARAGNYDDAYELTSEGFRAATSKAQLEEFVKDMGFDSYVSASWSSRSFENDSGKLIGTVTTEQGESSLTIMMRKESSVWLIHSISKPSAGLADSAPINQSMPSERAQVELVVESMSKFADAVAAKDMSGFRDFIANLWRNQFTTEKLNKAYGSMMDGKTNLHVLDNIAPQFDTPTVFNDSGFLVITGHYPSTPSQTYFTFKYVFEGTSWKMVGLNIQIK